MSTNHFSKNNRKPFKKPINTSAESASSDLHAQTQTTSANGVKNSGKPCQTNLQYGRTSFSKSATSQNGGASVIDISDKAKAVLALSDELKALEKVQLEVGEKMAVLLFEQMRLAEKCRAINRSMEALLK